MFAVRKCHGAVGWVWWSKNGDWTKQREDIREMLRDDAEALQKEFQNLNPGWDDYYIDDVENI